MNPQSREVQQRREAVLDLVRRERERQVQQYGFNHDLTYGFGSSVSAYPWLSPYSDEEAGNVCEAFRADYAGHVASHGSPSWMHLIREEVAELFETETTASAIEEAVQVAALCVSLVERMMDQTGGADMPESASVQISEENRRILYEAYDDGNGDTISLRNGDDDYFTGYWLGEKIVEGIEIAGVLHTIVPASDRTVSVIVGKGLVENDLGVVFSTMPEAKAYILGMTTK